MDWYYTEGKKIPIGKIASYLIGVVALSFALAHVIGKEMTRDGEPAQKRPGIEQVKPSVPGPFQGETQP